MTLAAWVNLYSADTGGAEVISLGDSVSLRLDATYAGWGLVGAMYDGTAWVAINHSVTLAGTGWHHVAYSFNDAGNLATLYLDGVAVASTSTTSSISYTLGANSYIGTHGNGDATFDFNGKIDEARVYNRVLSTNEIASLANELVLTDTGNVNITVAAVNDAPIMVGVNGDFATVTEDAVNNTGQTVGDLILSMGVDAITDPDGVSEPEGIAIFINNEGTGTWQYKLSGSSTWLDVGTVTGSSALLLRSTDSVRFLPNGEEGSPANFGFRAWDQSMGNAGEKVSIGIPGGDSAFSSGTQSALIAVDDVNDAPILFNPSDLADVNNEVMHFEGGDDSVVLTGLPVNTASGTEVTVEFWMNWNGIGTQMPFGFQNYDLYNAAGFFGFNTGAGDIYGIDTPGLSNGWHHVAAVFHNGDVTGSRLMIDGVEQVLTQKMNTPNHSVAFAGPNATISGWPNNGSYRFTGDIDELRIWNGARSEAEIQSLMHSTLSGPQAGLVASYSFTGATAAAGGVIDDTGNGHDGTMIGMTDYNVKNVNWYSWESPAVSYTENDPATAIYDSIQLVDVDSTNLTGATIAITGGHVSSEDVLAFTVQNGITIDTWDAVNGILTLTGTATVAQYETALQSVTYQNTSDNPNTTDRTISWSVTDGSDSSVVETSTIEITEINDAPIAIDDPSGFESTVQSNGPVGYWRLGETTGATAIDASGNGNDGTYNGVTLGVGGVPNAGADTAVDFDGVNDSIDLGTFDVDGTGLTLSAWINVDDFDNSDQRIISKAMSTGGNAEADHWWMLSTHASGGDNVLRFRVKAGGTTDTLIASTGDISTDQWHFVAATYDEATGAMKIYLNGIEVGSKIHSVGGAVDTDASQTVMIGANPIIMATSMAASTKSPCLTKR